MASVYREGQKWRVQVRRDGRSLSKAFSTKKAAQRWAYETERSIEAGGVPTTEAGRTTLCEALERYRSEVTPSKRGSAQEAVRIGQWMDDPLAKRPLSSIRSTDIAAWRDRMVAAGYASSTIRNHATIISQVYRAAFHEWGFEGLRNPVLNVRMPKMPAPRQRRLMPGEYERLVEAASGDCNAWVKPAIVLAVETGMRAGELLIVEWSQIEGRVLTLRADQTKNGKFRSIPLSATAMAVLETMPRAISGRIIPLRKSTLDKAWRRVCKEAEVEGAHWHDLRAEAASRWLAAGMNPMMVARLTGHSDLKTLLRYAEFDVNDFVRFMDG